MLKITSLAKLMLIIFSNINYLLGRFKIASYLWQKLIINQS